MISSRGFYYAVAKRLCSITKWKIITTNIQSANHRSLLRYKLPNAQLHIVLHFMSDEGFATIMLPRLPVCLFHSQMAVNFVRVSPAFT